MYNNFRHLETHFLGYFKGWWLEVDIKNFLS